MKSFSFEPLIEPLIFHTSFLKIFENCGNLIHCRCEGGRQEFHLFLKISRTSLYKYIAQNKKSLINADACRFSLLLY